MTDGKDLILDNLYPNEGLFIRANLCRHCNRILSYENKFIADGCGCNCSRGTNHGLVPKNTCTCVECDPNKTGSSRIKFNFYKVE